MFYQYLAINKIIEHISCQGSVPQAFEAFFESKSYEDAIRNVISIGGDSDLIEALNNFEKNIQQKLNCFKYIISYKDIMI